MAGRSSRVLYKHKCGYEFSIKLNGVTKTRTCPGCGKEVYIDQDGTVRCIS